jgi:hypothetical protein
MQEGVIPAKAFITHRTRLEQLVEVMPGWMEPAAGVVKGIVEC